MYCRILKNPEPHPLQKILGDASVGFYEEINVCKPVIFV